MTGVFRLLLAVLLSSGLSIAQNPPTSSPPVTSAGTKNPSDVKTADPKDVDSVDHIIAALYDVISGPQGKQRDWERMRTLFFSGAHLIPTGKRPTGEMTVRMLGVDDYIERSKPFFEKEGFFETEIARRTENFGHVTHAWSTYTSRHAPSEAPFARGINSIQLVNDGKR